MLDPAIQPYYQRLTQNPDDAEALVVLWQWFGDRGQFQQLAQIAEQIGERRLDPASAADLFYRAGQLWALNLRRPDRAAPNFRKAYERDPNHVEAIIAARELYLSAGNFKNSAQLYEKELAIVADTERRLELVRGLADVRGRLNDPAGEAAALEEVIRLQPEDFQAMHRLAEAYQARAATPGGGVEDLMRAATLLTNIAHSLGGEHLFPYCMAALDAWPGDESAYLTLRDGHLQAGTLGEFAGRQIAFLQANPESSLVDQLRRDLTALYASAGQFDDAIQAFSPLALHDNHAKRELADLYRAAGRVDERVALIAELPAAEDLAVRLHDLREMAAVYGQQGHRDAMLGALYEILRLEPADPEALSFIEEDLRAQGEWSDLRQVLYSAARAPGVAAESKLSWLRDIAAFSERKLGDAAGAIEAWRTILSLSPDDDEASNALERLLESEQRWEELCRWLEKRASRSAESGSKQRVFLRLANLYRDQLGDAAGEGDALSVLWNLDPTDTAIATRLTEARRRAGDYAGVADVLRSLAELSDDEDRVARYTELALHLEGMQSLDEALHAWQQVVTTDPSHAGSWDAIEALLERTSRHDLLLETLIAHAEGPAAGTQVQLLHGRAAQIARLLGDVHTTISQARRALELSPGDEAIAGLLGDALEAAGLEDELLELLRARVGQQPDGEPKIETLRRLGRALSRTDMDAARQSWEDLRAVTQNVRGQDDVEALEALAGFAELAGDEDRLATLLDEAQLAARDDSGKRASLMSRRADVLESLGRKDEAIEVLRDATENVSPREPALWAQLARVAEVSGRYDLVATSLETQAAIAEDDEARAALAMRLVRLCDEHLSDGARTIAALELWYDADPMDNDVARRLFDENEKAEIWGEAAKYLRVLVEVEEDADTLCTLRLKLAVIHEQKLNDPETSFEVLAEGSLEHESRSLVAARELAERARLQHRLVELLAQLADVSGERDRAVLHDERSALFEGPLNLPDEAVEAAASAVECAATDASRLANVVRLAQQAHHAPALARAFAAFSAVVDSPDRVREVSVDGARALSKLQAPSLGLDLLLRALARVGATTALLDAMEDCAAKSGRAHELFVVLDKQKSSSRDDAERFVLSLRGARVAASILGDLDATYGYLKQALALAANPRSIDRDRLLEILELGRRVDVASPAVNLRTTIVELFAEVAKEQEEDEPRLAAALYFAAAELCDEDLALPDHAWALYVRALDLWPADHTMAPKVEIFVERVGRLPELVDRYQQLIDDAYDAETARSYQARRASILGDKLGRIDDAIDALRTLVEIAPKDRAVLRTFQILLRNHGRFQDLLLAYERELEQGTDNKVEVYRAIARTWHQDLRNNFEAKDAWKRVLKLAPEDPEARAALETLERKKRVDLDDDLDDADLAPPTPPSHSRPPPPRLSERASVLPIAAPVYHPQDEEAELMDDLALVDSSSALIEAPAPDAELEALDDDLLNDSTSAFLAAPPRDESLDDYDEDDALDVPTGEIQAPPSDHDLDELDALPAEPPQYGDGSEALHADTYEPADAESWAHEGALTDGTETPLSTVDDRETPPARAAIEEQSVAFEPNEPIDEATPVASIDALAMLSAFDDADEDAEPNDAESHEVAHEEVEDEADLEPADMAPDELQEAEADPDDDSLESLADLVAPQSHVPSPPASFKPPALPPLPGRKP
ncbi:MAG: hypothetical protein Q8Q09_28915 [Deltaproteobacteria bacterium]|nr:hypothetical protein [Deltaproteobacteria bacterium]